MEVGDKELGDVELDDMALVLVRDMALVDALLLRICVNKCKIILQNIVFRL